MYIIYSNVHLNIYIHIWSYLADSQSCISQGIEFFIYLTLLELTLSTQWCEVDPMCSFKLCQKVNHIPGDLASDSLHPLDSRYLQKNAYLGVGDQTFCPCAYPLILATILMISIFPVC